jgi:hypothetical protein
MRGSAAGPDDADRSVGYKLGACVRRGAANTCLQIAVISRDSWPDLRGWPSVSDRGVPSATRVNGTLMARRDGRRRTQGQHQAEANRHWSVDLASGLLDDPACA